MGKQSQTTPLGGSDPDAADPDAADPDAANPDAANPDAANPDAANPDAANPDAAGQNPPVQNRPVQNPRKSAAPLVRLRRWLDDTTWVRRVCAVLAGIALLIVATLMGFWTQMASLAQAMTGRLGLVLIFLIVGILLLIIGLLGGRAIPAREDMIWPGAILGYLLLAWLVLSSGARFNGGVADNISAEARRLQAISFGVISVIFLLVVVTLITEGAVAAAFSSKTSTAPTVILLWSAVVVYALAFIAALALTTGISLECKGDAPTNCVQTSAWPDYLLLLGLPGVAAAIAKSRKETSDDGEVKSQEADETGTATSDRITEVQFFVFNAIAMVFVVWALATSGVLGDIPDVLLGLTGASALTFSLAKRLPAAPEK